MMKITYNSEFEDLIDSMEKKTDSNLEAGKMYGGVLGWKSIINFPKGYAFSSRFFLKSLYELGVDVRYEYAYGPGTPFTPDEARVSEDRVLQEILNKNFLTETVQVLYGQGDIFYKNNGKYKVGFTMLETDGVPKEWVAQCNQMDEVWVPSKFNVETFKNSGVKVPVRIVPLGVDLKHYYPARDTGEQNRRFVFLSVFEWGRRKAPELLLKAFNRAFTAQDEVVLICKITNHNPAVDLKHEIDNLELKSSGGQIEIFENVDLTEFEMAELYRHADCFVLPTHGEGWGMPILEAMACGLPVIATGWSSQMDFFDDDAGYCIRVKELVEADNTNQYYMGFNWAMPDEEHFVHLMRHVHENRSEARKKGRLASERARNKLTWQNSADIIYNYIKDINI